MNETKDKVRGGHKAHNGPMLRLYRIENLGKLYVMQLGDKDVTETNHLGFIS